MNEFVCSRSGEKILNSYFKVNVDIQERKIVHNKRFYIVYGQRLNNLN